MEENSSSHKLPDRNPLINTAAVIGPAMLGVYHYFENGNKFDDLVISSFIVSLMMAFFTIKDSIAIRQTRHLIGRIYHAIFNKISGPPGGAFSKN